MLSALSVAEFCLKEAVRLVCSSLLLASVLWRSTRSRDFSLMGSVCPPRRGTTRPPEPTPPPPAPPSPVLSARRVPLTPPAGFFGKGGGSFLSSWPNNSEMLTQDGHEQWIYCVGWWGKKWFCVVVRDPMQKKWKYWEKQGWQPKSAKPPTKKGQFHTRKSHRAGHYDRKIKMNKQINKNQPMYPSMH